MTQDEIRYRRCSIKDCPYKEFRGPYLGNFVKGSFVCPAHALAFFLGADFQFKDGNWTRDTASREGER